jgi:hypothetical protein
MLRFDLWGMVPGMTTASETYETAATWAQYGVQIHFPALIDAAAIDSGNSPTYELRQGLVLGLKTTTNTWTNYAATNTDGSEVARGILVTALRMQDFQGNTGQRMFGVIVGGPIRSANLLGLDGYARQQMAAKFQFDDDTIGQQWYPYKHQLSKTTAYTLVAADTGTLFDNTGAGASVTFTLPAVTTLGFVAGFRVITGQNVLVTSAEGTNIITYNNASASTIAFQTASHLIGGGLRFYTNPAGTKWICQCESADPANNTITIS